MSLKRVMPIDDLWEGELRAVEINGRDILIVKFDGEVHAYENRCPHQGGRLTDGTLQNRCVQCPLHQWSFDLCTGKGVNPQTAELKSLTVRLHEECIYVDA